MVGSNKVTTWVPYNGAIEFLESLNNVLSETVLIRERVARVVDSTVDASSHVPMRSVLVGLHIYARSLGREAGGGGGGGAARAYSVKPP